MIVIRISLLCTSELPGRYGLFGLWEPYYLLELASAATLVDL